MLCAFVIKRKHLGWVTFIRGCTFNTQASLEGSAGLFFFFKPLLQAPVHPELYQDSKHIPLLLMLEADQATI